MNNENMTIKIITEEAKEIDASVISIFEIKESSNKYAIYTFNEEDAQGLVKIYASRLVENDGLYTFESIADASEWTKIKEVMKDTAKENSSYITNGDIILISASSIKRRMNEPISVRLSETKAAKIGPNYKTGISNNYLNNVKDDKSEEPSGTEVETPIVVQEESAVEVPSIEQPKVESPEPVVTPEPVVIPQVEVPEVKVEPLPKIEEPVKIPEINVDVQKETPVVVMPSFELPKEEPKEIELPEIPKFETPSIDEEKEEFETPTPIVPKSQPNVDSILNKASYFQNLEEPKKEDNKENIIQTIGLEFMRKVSELAEYEKELNNKNREIEAKERVLSKIEKEIINKENRQKYILQTTKDKELELKKKDRELAEKEADLNRRILEFNKKISMFQQTFETISPVD